MLFFPAQPCNPFPDLTDSHSRGQNEQRQVCEQITRPGLKQQLEQLEFYKAGVRAIGAPLAKFAEVVPMRVQLKELSISKPRPQVLMPPGAKVPLFGPIENVETQKLVIVGLATKETPVVSLMESLESGFETLVTGEHNVNSFKQDNTEIDGKRLLSFEIEYSMPGRRFAK